MKTKMIRVPIRIGLPSKEGFFKIKRRITKPISGKKFDVDDIAQFRGGTFFGSDGEAISQETIFDWERELV